jgi:hypothetical protein
MKITYLWLVVLSISFISCKKEQDFSFTYPTQLKSTRLKNTTGIRLFTRAGEVKDQRIIEEFAARYSKDWLYYDGITQMILAPQADTLEITIDQIAYFKSTTGVSDYTFTEEKDGYLLFTPKHPYKTTATGGMLSIEPDSDEYLSKAIEKYDLVSFTKKLVPVSTGFANEYEITVKKIATASRDHLEFPLLGYTVLTGTGFQRKVYSVKVNNRFNEKGVTQIQNTDTLAIQEFTLSFER